MKLEKLMEGIGAVVAVVTCFEGLRANAQVPQFHGSLAGNKKTLDATCHVSLTCSNQL